MDRQLFIGNQWCDAIGQGKISCIDPASETEFGTVPAGVAADIDCAVTTAREAYAHGWKQTPPAARATLLRAYAAKIRGHRAELADLETQDNGKPLAESLFDVDTAATIFDMYAGLADELQAAQQSDLPLAVDYLKVTIARQPVGVVGLITPWNFPIEQFTWKVAAALAAGCCCVVKPSEVTSVTALAMAELAAKAGFPAGVLNVVTGYGKDAGSALVAHPGVDKISFTGSTATGKAIMTLAAQDLKKVSLELGGKSPVIVFDDVNIDRAVEWVMFGAFVNQGQVCTSTSRLLLDETIAPQFLARLKTASERIVVGDGKAAGVQMGPLSSKAHFDKVMGYIDAGITAGAKLLTGGSMPKGVNRGYFVQPTVFTDVTPDMSIWREEIFGPVLSVRLFTDEADAVRQANDTPYGLAATVLSEDLGRADRVADQIDAGIIWQNCNQMVVMEAPWGGMKKSGFGRELGKWGMEAFQEVKQKTRWLPDAALGWYPPAP